MEESLTPGSENQDGLQPQPTVTTQTPEADVNQEAISTEQSQEAASDDGANKQEGAEGTDDGLAKFAKGQGISDEDFATLSDREKKFLKIAKDNQAAARNKPADKNLSQANEEIDTAKPGETEDEAFKREFRQYKYERQADQFWAQEGRDRSLEPAMVGLLNKKIEELTPTLGPEEARKYAFNLSRDLPTLYSLASIESGSYDPNAAFEQGRREERDSIRRQATAAPAEAHAASSAPASSKVDLNWVQNEYDSTNPEHVKLLDEALARGDLY